MEKEIKFKVLFQRGDCFETVAVSSSDAWKICVNHFPHTATFDVLDIITEDHSKYNDWEITLK